MRSASFPRLGGRHRRRDPAGDRVHVPEGQPDHPRRRLPPGRRHHDPGRGDPRLVHTDGRGDDHRHGTYRPRGRTQEGAKRTRRATSRLQRVATSLAATYNTTPDAGPQSDEFVIHSGVPRFRTDGGQGREQRGKRLRRVVFVGGATRSTAPSTSQSASRSLDAPGDHGDVARLERRGYARPVPRVTWTTAGFLSADGLYLSTTLYAPGTDGGPYTNGTWTISLPAHGDERAAPCPTVFVGGVDPVGRSGRGTRLRWRRSRRRSSPIRGVPSARRDPPGGSELSDRHPAAAGRWDDLRERDLPQRGVRQKRARRSRNPGRVRRPTWERKRGSARCRLRRAERGVARRSAPPSGSEQPRGARWTERGNGSRYGRGVPGACPGSVCGVLGARRVAPGRRRRRVGSHGHAATLQAAGGTRSLRAVRTTRNAVTASATPIHDRRPRTPPPRVHGVDRRDRQVSGSRNGAGGTE